MATLLLPKLGVGNPVSFNNNFTVTKDANPWQDGGADTFDGTTGVQIGKNNQWLMLGGNAYTGPDGSFTPSIFFAPGINVETATYAGWVTAGIFALEVEYGFNVGPAPDLRFWCNTGYDNGSPTGVTTKPFQLNGHNYELKTVHVSYGAKDTWNVTGETQITVTMVPYLASLNEPGQNPFTWSGSGDDREFRLPAVQRGATVYIQWGKVNVDDVQTWIIADLVESEEFASATHERLPLHNYPPGVHAPFLNRLHSPCSDHWNTLGSCGSIVRRIDTGRKNIYFGGLGVISGTVKEKGNPDHPLVRQVFLYSENTRVLVASTWSDANGNYRFDHLDPTQRYTVISYDYKHQYRAVIADNLKPELP